MPTIKMLTTISTPTMNYRRGKEFNVDDATAEQFVRVGYAVPTIVVGLDPNRLILDPETGKPVEDLQLSKGSTDSTPPAPKPDPKFGGQPLSYFKGKTDEEILSDKSAKVGKPTLAKIRKALATAFPVLLCLALLGCSGCLGTSGSYYRTTKTLWQDDIAPSYREYVAADPALSERGKANVLRSADMFDKAIVDEAANQLFPPAPAATRPAAE